MALSIQRPLCQHLCRSGLPRHESARLASLISKWYKCSGEEWVAKRLKSLQDFFHARLAEPEKVIPVPVGFATRKNRKGVTIFRDRTLQRVFGVVGNLSDERSKTRRELCGMICKTGTLIKADLSKLSKIEEKLESIVSPHTGTTEVMPAQNVSAFVNDLVEIMTNGKVRREPTEASPVFGEPTELSKIQEKELDLLSRRLYAVRMGATPLCGVQPSGTKSWTYYLDDKGELRSGSLPHSDVRSLSPVLLISNKDTPLADPEIMYDVSACMQIYQQWVGDPFGMPILFNQRLGRYKLPVASLDLPVGKLSVLNKDGWAKRRIIAMPCLDLQTQLDPLKRSLNFMLMHFEASGVHDQDRAREDIVSWLRNDDMCFAYDQSSFTDRFPYKLQRQLLLELRARNLGVTNADIKMMDFAVSGKWAVPALGKDYHVSYAVGQPMGLNPSFALASLSHLMVAHSSYCLSHGQSKGWQDHIRIVGDDIVIRGRKTAKMYDDLMTKLGVTINYSKSMVSKDVSNFCGRILTKQGIDASVRVKQRDGSAMTVVQQLRMYTDRAWSYFRKAVAKYGDVITTPEPIGLGYKPPTMSYSSFYRQVDQGIRAELAVNKEIQDLVGVMPSKTSQRKMIKRRDDLRISWLHLGFIGSQEPNSPSVTAQDFHRYFGLSPEGAKIVDQWRFDLQRSAVPDGKAGRTVSSYQKLVDTAAKIALSDGKMTNVLLMALATGNSAYADYRQYVNKFGYVDPKSPSYERLTLMREEGSLEPQTHRAIKAMNLKTLTQLALPRVAEVGVPRELQIKVARQLLNSPEGEYYVDRTRQVCSNEQFRERFFQEAFSAERVIQSWKGIQSQEASKQRLQRQRSETQSFVDRERYKDISRQRRS